MDFEYESRPDIIQAFVSGKEIIQKLRLKSISTSVNNSIQKTYNLAYSNESCSRLNALSYIQNGKSVVIPTKFDYGAGATQSTSTEITKRADQTTKNILGYMIIDFNGDGKNELCDVSYENNSWVGGSFKMDYHYSSDNWSSKNPFLLSQFINGKDAGNIWTGHDYKWAIEGLKAQFGDFNGDGNLESTVSFKEANNVFLSVEDRINDVTLFNNQIIGTSSNAPFILSGNYYGNTLSAALVVFNSPLFVNGKYRYGYRIIKKGTNDNLSLFPTSNPADDPYYIYTDKKIKEISICNFGANHLHDDLLIKYEDNTLAIIRNSNNNNINCFTGSQIVDLGMSRQDGDIFTIADLNQDGLMDIIYWSPDLAPFGIQFLYNKGNYDFRGSIENFAEIDMQNNIEIGGPDQNVLYVLDINNDGLNDIVIGDEHFETYYDGYGIEHVCCFMNTRWSFYINNGSSFVIDNSRTTTISGRTCDSNFGDVTGDGIVDWICRTPSLVIKNFGFGLPKNLLTKVTDPTGNDLQISYKNLSENSELNNLQDNSTNINTTSEYLSSGFHPFNTSSIFAVSSIEKGLKHTSYKYGTALSNWAINGFVGFKNILITNEKTGISNLKYNNILQSKQLLVPSRVETIKGYSIAGDPKILTPNEIISGEEYIYSIRTNGSFRYYLENTNLTKSDYKRSIYLFTEYEYDTNGNLLSEQTSDNWNNWRLTNYHHKNINSWCLNKIDTITVNSFYNNSYDTYTRITAKTYDHKGDLVKEIVDPGDVNAVTTEYRNLNEYGLPGSVVVSSGGVERNTVFQYTNSGRFVQTKTDPINNTTSYNWNETNSTLSSVTNALGTTYNTYDDLNRLIESVDPYGIRTTERHLWASSDKPVGALYYGYTEVSGEAPVYVWFDRNGNQIQKDTYGLNGKKISVRTEYNEKGEVLRESEPYSNGTPSVWTTYTYDDYGRLYSMTSKHGETTYEYQYNTVRKTSPDGIEFTGYDPLGNIVESEVNNRVVWYNYDAAGRLKEVNPLDENYEIQSSITLEYDLQGNRTKIIDPDAGTQECKYNAFGDIIEMKQKVHDSVNFVTTNFKYQNNGLIESVLRQSASSTGIKKDTTVYSYDASNHYRLQSIRLGNVNNQSFFYDGLDRPIKLIETIGDRTFTAQANYDNLGRIKSYIYNSGYTVTNHYDTIGNLIEISDNSNRSIWKALDINDIGQLTSVKKGNVISTYNYDSRGYLSRISAPNIVDVGYVQDVKGNVTRRVDYLLNQQEEFLYDNQNRLTNWDITQNGIVTNHSLTYDDKGNITTKSDLDNLTMHYGFEGRPHALDTINGVPTIFPMNNLDVTYTDFKKIESLNEGNKHYLLTYGVDNQRRKSVYQVNGNTQLTRYYFGNYEEEITSSGNVRKIHYIGGGDGLAAIMISNNGKDSLLYAYSDLLGSLTVLTNDSGRVLERYAYDPWGKRRNPSNWTQTDTRNKWLVNRGFTGHEHIDAFQIINMNGRVYDPLTAQFFSPDPCVSSPGDWLSYNRYSYCLNNPFKYTDPSGNFIPAAVGVIIDAAIMTGGTAFVTSVAMGSMAFDNGGSFWGSFSSSFIPGVLSSIASSSFTYGIGSAFSHTPESFSFVREVSRAASHGIMGGVFSVSQGGSFMTGFAGGFVSSLVGSALSKDFSGALPLITALSGGIAAGLTNERGGWNWDNARDGAFNGLMIGTLNHSQTDGPVMTLPPLDNASVYDGAIYGREINEVAVYGTGKSSLIGFWNSIKYSIPIYGSCQLAAESLNNGYYLNAVGYSALAFLEICSFGALTELNLSAKSVTSASRTGTNIVYEGIDANAKIRYVGITERNAAIRFNEHWNSRTSRSLLDYRKVEGATNLNRLDARIWEQSLINKYGLEKNGGQLFNKINSIAQKSWFKYGINP